jgi:hypothetical protein
VAVNTTDAKLIPPLDQLYLFGDTQPGSRPPSEAGAAMLALISSGLFPTWALALYEPLSQAGQGHTPPPLLALIAADAILLAPQQAPGGWRGFLIAEGTTQGQLRPFHWPGDPAPAFWLAVPRASAEAGAVWAEEAAFLATQPSPHTPDSPGSQLL